MPSESVPSESLAALPARVAEISGSWGRKLLCNEFERVMGFGRQRSVLSAACHDGAVDLCRVHLQTMRGVRGEQGASQLMQAASLR